MAESRQPRDTETDEQRGQFVERLVTEAREKRTQFQPRPRSPKRPAATEPANHTEANQFEEPQQKRVKSPSPTQQQPSSPSSTKPQRSRATRPSPSTDFATAPRDVAPGKTLWSEGQPPLTRPPQQQRGHQGSPPTGRPAHVSNQSYRRSPQVKDGGAGTVNVRGGSGGSGYAPSDMDAPEAPNVNFMIPQPETRPISQEQLVAEVKGIYAGLVMVESKCIEVDNAQNSQNDSSPPLNKEQWQALIALHRTLLHEHHDFFLASQHPSASHALRRLANKYAMPARMWRHGIHSFLELLRHRLPDALEYMQTFIYLAYSMMALLYETLPAFEETWIECLGDLSRYRMAIEDDDLSDRETWTSVSRLWYSKASPKTPVIGRLHHHLAILAKRDVADWAKEYERCFSVGPVLKSGAASWTIPTQTVNSLLADIDSPGYFRQSGQPGSGPEHPERPLPEDWVVQPRLVYGFGGREFSSPELKAPLYYNSFVWMHIFSMFFQASSARGKRTLSGKWPKMNLVLLAFALTVNVAYALSPPDCNAQCGAWIGAGLATATNYFAVQLTPPANTTNWPETAAVCLAFVLAVVSVGLFGSALSSPAGRGQQHNLYYLMTFMFTVVCFLAVAAMPSGSAHPVISYTPTLIELPASVLFLLWNSIRPSAEELAPPNAA